MNLTNQIAPSPVQYSQNIGPGIVSNDLALSLLRIFCSFGAYVSEKTCFHRKDSFSFSFNSFSLLFCFVLWVKTLWAPNEGMARLKFEMLFQSGIVVFFLNIFSRVINV